jgi:hypothetical protein
MRENPIAATAHGATFGLVFLLVRLAASWLQLFRREEAWKTSEILIVR